ncbi:MAG: acetylxylan esterase [Niabella sp.]
MITKVQLKILHLVVFLLTGFWVLGQSNPIKIEIKPSIERWIAKTGETVSFKISIDPELLRQDPDGRLAYQIGPEMMPAFITDTLKNFRGAFISKEYTMKTPGFLRCIAVWISGTLSSRQLCTIGYDAEKIQPTQKEPGDFDEFWKQGLQSLKSTPINAKKTLLTDRSTVEVDVFHLEIGNVGGSKIFGILAMPSDAGKYPAVLQVPGAGVRPYGPDIQLASRGVIVLTIGIHGIPVNLDSSIYKDLADGALKKYFNNNLNSKENNYYRRVYLGCVRANDYLCSLDNWDGKNLAVMGGSQGGALSIVTAALDSRVTLLSVLYPALSDLTGYLYNRAGGWPHYLAAGNEDTKGIEDLVSNTAYYDVVNFAKRIKVPGIYSWGFNDIICPPTSMYAAYNTITASKKLNIYKETGHWAYPTQKQEMLEWVLTQFK